MRAKASRRAGLAGVVLVDQLRNARVDIAGLNARVQTSNAQMGRPLYFFPVGFQFVLVPKFRKKRVQGVLIKHNGLKFLGGVRQIFAGSS